LTTWYNYEELGKKRKKVVKNLLGFGRR
jgi:hypothetical protein